MIEPGKMREREIIRYLGYKKIQPDEQVITLIHQCMEEVGRIAQPRHIYRRLPLTHIEEGKMQAEGVMLISKSLERNLKDCDEVIFFAATLGHEVDRLMERYLKLNITKAAVLQATAAEAIETYCNECQRQIEEEVAKEGLFVRPRYSPGYGDLSLTIQPDFLRVLNAQKTIGLFLSEGGVMQPEKSVTALMGLSRTRIGCTVEGCEACSKKDCTFRRDE